MIRDFSLVFLLLISDRRKLHRDSRRDTEQNVPWPYYVIGIAKIQFHCFIAIRPDSVRNK